MMVKQSILFAFLACSLTVKAADLTDILGTKTPESKFLAVDEAFQTSINTKGDNLTVSFNVVPGHYVYQNKIKISVEQGVTASSPNFNLSASFIDDPLFGRVAMFDQPVAASFKLTNPSNTALNNVPVTIKWQGCAKAGICYPPQTIHTSVSLSANLQASTVQLETENTRAENATEVNGASTSHIKNISSVTQEIESQKEDENKVDLLENADIELSESKSDIDALLIDAQKETQDVSTSDISDNELLATGLTTDEQVSLENINSTQITEPQHIVQFTEAEILNNKADDVTDVFGLKTNPLLALLLIFIAGLGLALTPCVWPMIPIVANIVANQGDSNKITAKKSFLLSLSYGFGVAVAYGLLGATVAYAGEALGLLGMLQNPAVVITFAIIFVLLGLYMLDIISIRFPDGLSQTMHKWSQAGNSKIGSISGSFIVGFLSALVVSPCVSAPLSGALAAVSTIGDISLGFIALFTLGFGLSVPLVIFATTEGKLLPKAGGWMNLIKQGFAYLMFAVALLMIERIFISPLMLVLWAAWFMMIAYWLFGAKKQLNSSIAAKISSVFSIVAAIWAVVLLIGASQGATDSWQPLQPILSAQNQSSDNHQKLVVTTLAELDEQLQQHPNVVVDVMADWCIECRIMDKNIFQSPPNEIKDWTVIKLDITEANTETDKILSRYQIFGPPALLYYQNNQLILKQNGEVDRETFIEVLRALKSLD